MPEIRLKRKYRTAKLAKRTTYSARTGNSNGRQKISKAKRAALGKGEKRA